MRRLFYRTPPGDCFCFTEKFTTKIVKRPLEKEKKQMGTACKKNNDTRCKKTS